MKKRDICTIAAVPFAALLFSLAGGPALAEPTQPMTPELAAKREMVRKQEDQRVTQQEKQAAADALKAMRLKVYKAKQAAKNPDPSQENKEK